jgi:hypothetical protein
MRFIQARSASRRNVGCCRMATHRRDGKASVARSFRLVTLDGMVRTTSRTSSSSPPASPIPASFIQARSASRANVGCCRIATHRRDGKASVARSFRLVTLDGMVRTTSRTSSSSPPASPIPAPFIRGGEFSTCRMRALTAAATRRRDGKASVARSFRLVTRDGVARTTSRTSSSSPPASPIPAPFIQARSAGKGNSDGGPVHP